jgi:hypothetical protein
MFFSCRGYFNFFKAKKQPYPHRVTISVVLQPTPCPRIILSTVVFVLKILEGGDN